jgi:hypothetical protein
VKSRVRAARSVYVLYRAWRELALFEEIAEGSGLRYVQVKTILDSLRAHGEQLFYSARPTYRCCRRWRKTHLDFTIAPAEAPHRLDGRDGPVVTMVAAP